MSIAFEMFSNVQSFRNDYLSKKIKRFKSMKIVIADTYAALPGDIDWEGMDKMGECTYYERTSKGELPARAADADMILVNKTFVSKEDLDSMPKLKYIGVMSTGTNTVDVEEAKRRGIIVTHIPQYSTESVAQMAISHLLNIAMPVARFDADVKSGMWGNGYRSMVGGIHQFELSGLTMGVVGLGAIGSRVAEIAHAFGMKIIAHTSKSQELLPEYIKKADSLEDLFKEADVVSLHCPLNNKTANIASRERIALMKSTAVLINVSRGGLVDEEALAEALNEQRIYAAGLDVLAHEPARENEALFKARNCFITPHMGWYTAEAKKRYSRILKENVKAFVEGKPINMV